MITNLMYLQKLQISSILGIFLTFASCPNWYQTFFCWQDPRLFWCFGKEIRKNVFKFATVLETYLLYLKKNLVFVLLLCINSTLVPTFAFMKLSFYVFVVPLMSYFHQLERKPSFFSFTYSYLLTTEFPLKSLEEIQRMWDRGDKNLSFSTLNMFKIVVIQFTDMKGKNRLE